MSEETEEVFTHSRSKGIYLGDSRLDFSYESVLLTELHDHYAVRLEGVPADVDIDKLKFYLSDLASNIVTEIVFRKDGNKAVAYFKNKITGILV